MKNTLFKKMLLLSVTLLAFAAATEAGPVDMRQAREVGARFVNNNTRMRTTANDLRLVTTYSTSDGVAAFRVFNTSNGFVIVAADDCSIPILVYSEEGQFDVNNIPVQMEGYLQVYRREIEHGIQHRLTADESISKQWNMLQTTGSLYGTRVTTEVAPLLSTMWNQDCYYNALCPEDTLGPCGHVYTGCVATAMGQIMRYWQYPEVGSGSHSYSPNGYPDQTVDFGATTYDWDNMPNYLYGSSSVEQINAVATLLWHCGVAVNMMYGPNASGGYTSDVPYALTEYFNYSDDIYSLEKTDNESWLALIKSNLDSGLPVMYSASDTNGGGGHAFVCDGYDANDYLHFNWGWSGTGNNAYFALDALNVNGYQYNDYNYAVFNIYPDNTQFYQITAEANPEMGGTVNGAGSLPGGSVCTLTAVGAYNYVFVNWTKDGVVVSTNPVFSFEVTEDVVYTANFELFEGVTVGEEGTITNEFFPSYSYYCYSLTEQIYTSEDLQQAGIMRTLAFYNDGITKTQDLDIYMAYTDKNAFASNTDWIAVTENDLVFSGVVTLVAGTWTTLTLDNPFIYDGTSNLVLVVDNNTGSWTDMPNMACRVFETDEIQAMRVYSDPTNYNPSSPSAYTGTLYSQKNQLRIAFDEVTPSNSSEPIVTPDAFDLGYRPNNAWMRPFTFQIYNPGNYTYINSITTDNPYFQLEGVEVPFVLGYHQSLELNMTSGNGEGENEGHLIINYGDNQTLQYDLSAVAYDPVVKDVWETAYEVTSFPFTDSLIVADIPLYDNYNLPPTMISNGADAVYKLEFTEDTYLNASLTSGENGKIALYSENFQGFGGPDINNSYAEAQIIEDWLYYDNGTFATSVGAGGTIYWGAMFPAASLAPYAGTSLTKVAVHTSYACNATVNIYVGGNTPGGSPAATQDFAMAGDGEFMEVNLTNPVAVDGTQNLWIIVYQSGETWPADACSDTGDANNRWVSLDGSTWYDLAEAGLPGYGWMVRGFVTNQYGRTMVIDNGGERSDLGCEINDVTVVPGTYYLVASSTSNAWGIEINTSSMPCPEMAFNPVPADNASEVVPTAVQLHWTLGERTTEYKLLFGLDQDNMSTLVDWTRDLAESYLVSGLLNNTTYYWQIMERNDGCPESVEGPVWTFSTQLNAPYVYCNSTTLFNDEYLWLYWTPWADTCILSYNIYQDNEWIGSTTADYYEMEPFAYNMQGYNFHITAQYVAGESNPSNTITVMVSGYGNVEGHVYEQDGVTGIENATITFFGQNEFGYTNNYYFTTDAEGYYTGILEAGTYSATASCDGYQDKNYDGMISVAYNETTAGIDLIMDELFNPVSDVFAKYYPDAEDPNSPYVEVSWSKNPTGVWHTYCESENFTAVSSSVGQENWAYEYPAAFLFDNYAGWRITKVSLFSDNIYNAVGGNYTCRIYVGGTVPAEGMLVSELTVDVPQGLNDWVDWDLTTPVSVTGEDPIWVVWTANTKLNNWPAGCFTGYLNDCGTWWNGGSGWEHMTYGNWAMRQWFSSLATRSEVVSAPLAIVDTNPISCNLRNFADGDNGSTAICINPEATEGVSIAWENNRSFSYYRVYRTDAYNDGPYTEDNTVLLADNVNDTILIDVTWQDAEAGMYKYGVSCVYEGNRESQIMWTGLEESNHNAYTQPMNQSEYNDPNGPAPFVVVPDDASLPILRTQSSEAFVARWHHGNDFARFFLNNPTQAYSLGFTNDVFTNGACYMNGTLYFSDSNGKFGTINPENGLTVIATDRPFTVIDDNPVDGKMYGCDPSGYLYEINPNDGSYVQLAYMPVSTLVTFTITNDGRFIICDRGDETIKEYDPVAETLTTLISFDWDIHYGQDMATDRETNEVYWAAYNNSNYTMPLIKIDLDSNTAITVGYFDGQVSAFAITDNHTITTNRESDIVWSNFIDKNMYLADGAVNITVSLNSGDSPEGVVVSFTNLNEVEQATHPIADIILDATGYYAFDSFRRGDYQVEVSFNGYSTLTDVVSIWEATDLNYVLSEINYNASNIYVSSTGWAMWEDSTVPPEYSDSFYVDFEGGLPEDWTVNDANNDGYTWCLTSAIPTTWPSYASLTLDYYHNGSDAICSGSYINGVGALNPDEYLISPQVNIVNGSQLSFWVAAADASYAADHFGVFVSTTGTNPEDFSSVQEWTLTAKGESKADNDPASREGKGPRVATWRNYTVDLSAYAGNACYIAFRHYNCYDMYIMILDDIALTIDAKGQEGTKHFEQYHIELADLNNNLIYQGTTNNRNIQLPVDDLVDGETYRFKVASEYSTGMSQWKKVDWVYQSCNNYEGVTDLNLEMYEGANVLSWTYPDLEERSLLENHNAFISNIGGGNYSYGWLSFDVDSPSDYTSLNSALYLYGGDYSNLDGYVHSTHDGNWYKFEPESGVIVEQGYFDYNFYDCAWDYSSGIMYAIQGSHLYRWNIEDNTVEYVGYMGMDFEVLACDLNGQLWGIAVGSPADLYKIDHTDASLEYVGSTGQPCQYYWQSGGFDHYTGKLYWYGAGFYAEVNTETGIATIIESNTGSFGHGSFTVPYDGTNSPLGAMVYREGEFLGFTTETSYTDTIVTGNHEYEIRVVYNGPAGLPNHNVYYSMSCPQSIGGSIFEVSVTAEPEECGVVTGSGSYINGFSCTLTTTANPGYEFACWTINGNVVSNEPTYTFIVHEDAICVAHYGQSTPLTAGWNWWSTYIEQDGIDGLLMLENSLGGAGIRIQGFNASTDYFEYQGVGYWYGPLNEITNEQMYKIRTNESCNAIISGSPAEAANHPMTIHSGWNWIGFPSSQSIDVNDALSGFTAEPDDIIKGRNVFASYISSGDYNMWYGTLNTLEPGQGYMYKSNSSTLKTLVIQTGRESGELVPNATPYDNFYVPADANYANNMLIIAVIEVDGEELRSENYELAAFAGDECRGSVKLMYVEPIDRYVAFLLVFGDEAESLHFVLTDGGDMGTSGDQITYISDGLAGTLTEPVTLHFGTLGLDDDQMMVNIYPNPSKGLFNIEGKGIQKIEVADIFGQVILSSEVENDYLQINLSDKAEGTYLLRIVTADSIITRKLVTTK